jgi:malonyl CoA-acyl carrier protein transacylase
MQAAADANPSGMVSVLGLTLTAEKVKELCAEASKTTKESGFKKT